MDLETIKELVPLVGGTQLFVKLVGPSIEYIGNEIKAWNEKRLNNLKSIFSKAATKVDIKNLPDGQVSPRVLKEILNEATWNEDELSLEYFAGILASSRTGIDRDDRGAIMMKIVSQLTTYQLRAHYITYQIIRRLLVGQELAFTKRLDREKMQIFISINDFYKSMDFVKGENPEILIPHIFFGLRKFELIDKFYYGTDKGVTIDINGNRKKGIRIIPSALGAELFLWVYGKSNLTNKEILNDGYEFPLVEGIQLEGEYSIIILN